MTREVRVPSLPESVADATVLTWHKQPGDAIGKDENLVDLETDKVVLEVPAPAAGVLAEIKVQEGEVVGADALLAMIEEGAAEAPAPKPPASEPQASKPSAPKQSDPEQAPATSTAAADDRAATAPAREHRPSTTHEPALAPAARRLVRELDLDPTGIPGSGKGGRVSKADVMHWLDRHERSQPPLDPETSARTATAEESAEEPAPEPVMPGLGGEAGRPEQRVPMTRLRVRIAERLVEAQRNAAILTTFNEVDMHAVMDLRARYKDRFEATHGVRLGLMSFFVKAAVEALQRFPVINASVDGQDVVYHGYYDIGIAVSTSRGLVVPILRNCDQLAMADIERGVADFAAKAHEGTLSFEELTGGTFSITNGGVFGSLLSTPILNPPQSAVLGMHRIQERPLVVDGEIRIRPVMYLALSYDHRIIDGREAVQFLGSIKDALEEPARLLLRV